MIIEFAGFSGAGKSTLRDLVAHRFSQLDDIQVLSEGETLQRIGGASVVSRTDLLRAYSRVAWALPESIRAWQRYAKRYARLQQLFRRCPPASVCLLDEGVFQLIVGLCVKSRRARMGTIAPLLLRGIACPDLLCFVDAPVHVAEARMQARGRPSDDKTFTKREISVIDDLKATLHSLGERATNLNVMTLEAGSDWNVEAIAESIAAQVKALLSESRVPDRSQVSESAPAG